MIDRLLPNTVVIVVLPEEREHQLAAWAAYLRQMAVLHLLR